MTSNAGNILITGATGFLGSNLTARLLDENFSIFALCRKESNFTRLESYLDKVKVYQIGRDNLNALFQDNDIDFIIHCATNYGRRAVNPTEIIEANLLLPLNLMQMAVEHGVRAFINTDTILDKRVSYYSLSKSQFSEWLMLFAERILCINVALEHFYGPNDDPSKFVSEVIAKFLRNEPQIALTLGEQKRDFIFIDDVVEAFLKIVFFAKSKEAGFFNFDVGSGHNITIREFVTLVQKLAGNSTTHLDFGALPYRQNEAMQTQVDLRELTRLGWKHQVPLSEGLRRTIDSQQNTSS